MKLIISGRKLQEKIDLYRNQAKIATDVGQDPSSFEQKAMMYEEIKRMCEEATTTIENAYITGTIHQKKGINTPEKLTEYVNKIAGE